MILIYPPAAKPSEPPAGIAKIASAFSRHGIKCDVLDANLETLLYIIGHTRPKDAPAADRWTARALRNISKNYEALRDRQTYDNIDRYKRAVIDLTHAIEKCANNGALPGLANYRHSSLSPLRSSDLIASADKPERNTYYPYFSKRLTGLMKKGEYSVVGFSLNYLSQALCAFAMIGFLRSHFPGLKIILGGGLITSWTRNPDWSNPFTGLVDEVVSGPGEQRLLSIAGHTGKIETHYRPSYNLFPMNDYISPGPVLPYSASIGCYWNKCSFCPEMAEDNPYTPISVDRVLSDLNSLITRTGPGLIHLLDNSVSEALLKRLVVHPLGVPWYGFARVSSLLTEIDFCIALKNSGCVMLKLGLESGDQVVLDKMKKGINLEQASIVLRTLKKAGIASYVYLLFGTPAETLSKARNTLKFVIKHKDEIGFLNIAIFNMPICGQGRAEFETSSFYTGDLSLYTDFRHPEGWDRIQVRRFLDNEFKKHPAVSDILKKDPPIFTSNHAPFFVMKHK